MKKFIQQFLSKKRNVALSIFVLAILVGLTAYIIHGVTQNLEEITSSDSENQGTIPYFPTYPATTKSPELVKKGEYLAKAGDCIACHTNTPDKGKPFAGGLPFQTPFGTIYSTNITPDKETGIGQWTEEQFITAMTKGISPKGHYYYPAFPYLYFSKVKIEDLKAIKAYLDSLPPVHQENRKNKMVFPFNQRLLQLPWRLMFFRAQNTSQEARIGTLKRADLTDQIKRGAYLVEGLGHCAMCHSPSYYILSEKIPLGAPMQKFDLTGAKVQGYLAPDISKKNLSNASVEEIVNVFTKDELIGGGKVEGPMLEVNHDSLRYLNRADLEAIAVYLKHVDSEHRKPKVTKGGIGKATYENYCSGCHANGAGGAPKYGDVAAWDPVLKKGMPTVYNNALKGINGMPAKGTCLSCSDDDIKKAVDFMAASVSGKKAVVVPKVKKLTTADGKRLYEAKCSVCHSNKTSGAPLLGDKKAFEAAVNAGFLDTYVEIVTGKNGHPPRGACPTCTDSELIAALKYVLQTSSTGKNYELW